ncbi:MAG TPA: MOSC domain-containing protein, partial [Bacteroidales bacterium]|nr:MOSC domain-containing protein [Bacteroidales bacterium]
MKNNEETIRIVSVNISTEKGVIKHPVDEIVLDENGIINDAHAGRWHRQISLLADESVQKFNKIIGREVGYGEFAENITTTGILWYTVNPFDLIRIGDALLEVTQIGKKCHGDNCAIYREVGKCVMPKEGIFTRVIHGGIV